MKRFSRLIPQLNNYPPVTRNGSTFKSPARRGGHLPQECPFPPPRDLHWQCSSRLPHGLSIPSHHHHSSPTDIRFHLALLLPSPKLIPRGLFSAIRPNNNHDFRPTLQENHQPNQQSERLPTSPRLGQLSSSNQRSDWRRSRAKSGRRPTELTSADAYADEQ